MTVCARRSSHGNAFGRGFDSPRLHQMDIGRTPIISKAALLYWCGSDVKTKDGCQRLNAIDSRPFLLSYYKYYFGSSSFFCALSKNLGNTFIRRWPKGIIIIYFTTMDIPAKIGLIKSV